MQNKNDDPIIGYYEFFGAAIRCAMMDYSSLRGVVFNKMKRLTKLKELQKNTTARQKIVRDKLQRDIRNYETAKEFLFNPSWLEEMIHRCGLSDIVNIEYIRKIAQTDMKGDKYERNFLVRCHARTPSAEGGLYD